MCISIFAGFVCSYQISSLYTKYFSSAAIVLCLAILLYMFGVKRIKNNIARRLLMPILVIAAVIGIHLMYLLMVNGDFFGCGIFPWQANPNPNTL